MKSILCGDLDQGFIKIFLVFNFLLTLLISLSMYFIFSDKMAMGALFGGAISNLNCSGLYKDCIRTVKWQTIAAYYGGLAVRMGLISLAVVVLMVFLSDIFSMVGLFTGLSVGVINFYIIFFIMLLNKKNIFNKSYSQEVSK